MISAELMLAVPADVDEIIKLYRRVGEVGRANGSSDWDETYPTREMAEKDIAEGGLYILREDDKIVAAFTMSEAGEADSAPVKWTGNGRSCVLHRLCVAPDSQGRGMGARMVRTFAEVAYKQGYRVVRLMTPMINLAANRLYQRLDFVEAGTFIFDGIEFVCYESSLARLV